MLEKEYGYYKAHQDELVQKYEGKYLVIKDQCIIGVYDNEIDAIQETSKHHQIGTFLVHRCTVKDENNTVTFHSRVKVA